MATGEEEEDSQETPLTNLISAVNKLGDRMRDFENRQTANNGNAKLWQAVESALSLGKDLCCHLKEKSQKSVDQVEEGMKLLNELEEKVNKANGEIVVLQNNNAELKHIVDSMLKDANKLNEYLNKKHEGFADKQQMQNKLDELQTRLEKAEKSIDTMQKGLDAPGPSVGVAENSVDPNSLFNITEQVNSLVEWRRQQAGIEKAPPSVLDIMTVTLFFATAVATVIGITKPITEEGQTLLIPNFCYWMVFIVVGIILFCTRKHLR